MFGLGTEPWFRHFPYRGTPAGSLWRPAAPRPLSLATGAARAAPARSAPTGSPADADLAYAKAAADALGRAGDVSVPWEDPGTGARGTVTPLASAYTQDGFICRDFLASYVRKDTESWLQGEGCRIHLGRWEVRHMKPLERPRPAECCDRIDFFPH